MRNKEILVITKGHPYQREAFAKLFDQMEGVNWTQVEDPAAQAFFDPALARHYDAFVFYDIPGQRFTPRGPESWPRPARVEAHLSGIN